MGGNRSGKSEMGVVEDLLIASGWHPYIRPPIPNRGRIGVTDFKVLEQVIWPKMQKWLPHSQIKKLYSGYRGMISGVEFTNGSFFDIMSYEQLPMKWESVDLDWIHFDEPPPYEIFKASRARLIDRDGRMWFTLTPLEEPWIFEEIWEKCAENSRYWGIMVDIRQNPYLSRVAVQHFIEEISADDYEARVTGAFRHLTGRVFKSYTDLYPYVCTPDQLTVDPRWPRMMVVDPHEKTPWAVEYYALWEAQDTIVRYDEFRFDPAHSIDEFGAQVRIHEAKHNARIPSHMRIIDDYASKPLYNKGGNSLIDELRDVCGLDFRVADKTDRDKRLWDIIHRLNINPITHMPRWINMAGCTAARKEWLQHVWDKHRTKAGQWSEEKQTPVKKNDHAISCDHYATAEWPSTTRHYDPINILRARELETKQTVPLIDNTPISIVEAYELMRSAGAKSRRRLSRGS